MEGAGHSALLKFLEHTPKITMSELESHSSAIECRVPTRQRLRSVADDADTNEDTSKVPDTVHSYGKGDVDKLPVKEEGKDFVNNELLDDNDNILSEKGNAVGSTGREGNDDADLKSEENSASSKDDIVYSPVITVTKEESTLTKGDLKLQKVVVSEDISEDSTTSNATTLIDTEGSQPSEVKTAIPSELLSVPIRTDTQMFGNDDMKKGQGDNQNYKTKIQTKIPKLRLKQVIERITKDKQESCNNKNPEPSQKLSIPRLEDIKSPTQHNSDSMQNNKTQEKDSPKVDDLFDKIYEEIIENEASNNVPSPEKISDPIKLESKFEEIIHAYDENNNQPAERTKSKIPLLKRKSEQEIEIPPPSHRKHSLKRSNTEDCKGNKIPEAKSKEKVLESNVENIEMKPTNTTHEITAGIKSNVPLKKSNVLLDTVIKVNNPASMETKDFSKNSTTDNVVVISNKTNNNYVKDTVKCKIPRAFNSKESIEPKINSTILNKHPTRVSVSEKISNKVIDKQFEPAQSYNVVTHNVKSSTVSLQVEKLSKQDPSHVLDTTNDNNKFAKEQAADITPLYDIKSAKKDICPSQNKSNFNVSDKGSCTTVQSSNIVNISASNIAEVQILPIRNETEKNNATYETSNDNNIFENSKPSRVSNDSSIITEREYKEIEELQKITDFKDKDQIVKISSPSNGDQHFKNKNIESIKNYLESPIRTIVDETNNLEELKPDTQTISTQLPSMQTQSPSCYNKQIKDKLKQTLNSGSDNELLVSNPKTTDNSQAVADKLNKENNVAHIEVAKNIQTASKKQEKNSIVEDPSIVSTNIAEKEEEDIIMLKGKVDRVIRRLDSRDYKTVRKEIDDVPGISVVSKIALFDKCESSDPPSKTNDLNVHNTELINEINVVNDKPTIVNGILKTDGELVGLNDAVHSGNNVASKNKNDSEEGKLNTTDSNRVVKTKNLPRNRINEEKKIRRTVSSAAGDNNEVFAKRDDEAACLEIWKEYRRKKELDSDMRRAKSLAELDLGDAVKGRVRQLVVRLSSVEPGPPPRARGGGQDRPSAGSVSQRIALYERKLAPSRAGDPPGDSPGDSPGRQQARPHPAEAKGIGEDELRRKIEELRTAKLKYGQLDNMTYVELSDGGKMPVLALGTAMLEPALVGPVLAAAVELGYRAIDAAYVYGNEREVGQAIRDKIQDGTVTRSELFIINKLWSTFHRRDLVEKACRQSLDAMGLDYFDLYLIHNPMSFKEGPNPIPKIANVLQYSEHDYLDAWFGIEGLVKQGLVRRGGLSNFNSVQIERVIEKGRLKPVINQVECHPYLTQLRLEEFCLSRNIKLSCFGVLGSKGTPPELTSGLPPVIDDPLVKVMAAGLGITPAQLLINYQLQQGRGVVVKCSSAPHLAQALARAPLDAAQLAALHALNRNKRMFTFKGMGDTHRNYPFKIAF